MCFEFYCIFCLFKVLIIFIVFVVFLKAYSEHITNKLALHGVLNKLQLCQLSIPVRINDSSHLLSIIAAIILLLPAILMFDIS